MKFLIRLNIGADLFKASNDSPVNNRFPKPTQKKATFLFSDSSFFWRFFLLCLVSCPIFGWGQTTITSIPNKSYNNTDSRTFDATPAVATNCTSVDFTVTFNFSLGWAGPGNMESNDECGSGACPGDPNDPAGGTCATCWDFLWVRFMVNGVEIGGDLIGAGNNQQSGTISASGVSVNPGDVVQIEIYTQTWAADETISFSNVRITGTGSPADLNPIGPFCQNTGSKPLATNQNGITGTWSGTGVSGNSLNTAVGGTGTRTLTFTPGAGQCALPNTIDVDINAAAPVSPAAIGPFCQNSGSFPLGTNQGGFTGNWSGTGVSGNFLNTAVGGTGIRTLTFTPTAGQCATPGTADVEITVPSPVDIGPTGPFCQNSGSIPLSTNQGGISGNWSGTGVSGNFLNTAVGGTGIRTLTFTPTAGQCRTFNTVDVDITPKAPAALNPIGTVCQNGGNVALATTQNGISGIWSGTGVTGGNTLNPNTGPTGVRTLTFTPSAGQCANPNTLDITITPNSSPALAPIGPLCQTDAAIPLNTTQSGITGVWSGSGVIGGNSLNPGVGATGNRTLTFTPNAGQCASNATLIVSVNPNTAVSLSPIGPFCTNVSSVNLGNTQSGVTGTWSGTGVSGGNSLNPSVGPTGTRTLTFTPNAGQCATGNTLDVTINLAATITLAPLGPFCQSTSLVQLDTLQNGARGLWSGTGVVNGRALNTNTGGTGPRKLIFTPSSCSNRDSIFVTVNAQPRLDSIANVAVCGNSFTLPAISGSNLSGNQAYFSGSNGTGNRLNIGTIVDTSQTLFAYDAANSCADQRSFRISIQIPPKLDSVHDTLVCEQWVLPQIKGSNLSTAVAYYTQSRGAGTKYLPGQLIDSTQTLFVYDGNATCFDQDTFVVTVSPRPRLDTVVNVKVCKEFILPSIKGTALSGNEAYYSATNGAGTKFMPGQVIAADMRIFVFDQIAGCSSERSFLIDTLSSPKLDSLADTTTCGSLQLPPIKGTNLSPNVAYFTGPNGSGTRLSPGQTLDISANLFVFDQKANCSSEQLYRISITPGPKISLKVKKPISCNGSNDGALDLMVNNSFPPVNIRWSMPGFDGVEDPANLGPGTYTVTVTDGTSCEVVASVTLIEPGLITLSCAESKAVSRVNGSDGEANVSIGGGTGKYKLVLDGPVKQSLNNLSAGPNPLSGLSAGDYKVVLSDSMGCRDSCQFTITQPVCTLSASASQNNPACNGDANGQIVVNPDGGIAPLIINWNQAALNGQFNPQNLSAGTYTYTIEDKVGCQVQDTLILVNPAPLTLACAQQSAVTRVGGNNGVGRLSSNGGTAPYRISWVGASSVNLTINRPGDTSITGLKAGQYRIELRDKNDCIDSCTLTITEPICSLTTSIVVVKRILCNGDNNAVLTATVRNGKAPFAYLWSNGSGTATRDTLKNLGPGTYNLTLTDDLGCSDTAQILVTQPSPLIANCAVLSDATTVGGSEGRAVLRYSGGTGAIALDWGGMQPGSVISSGKDSLVLGNLKSSTYVPNFIDVNGCRVSCSFTINDPNCTLQASLIPRDPACQGATNGQIIAVPSAGVAPFRFQWSNNATTDTLRNLGAGSYQLTITDAINCSLELDTVLVDPNVLSLSCQTIRNVRTVNGNDGLARLSFAGGTGPYSIQIQGPINSNQTLPGNGDVNINGLRKGTYNVLVSDANGCQLSCSFSIAEPTCNLTLQLKPLEPLCQGASNGQIEVMVNGGKAPFQYDWNDNTQDGQAIARNLTAGKYTIVVTDSIGCVGFDSLLLSEPSTLTLICGTPKPSSTLGGQDGGITLRFAGGTGPYKLILSGSKQDSFLNISVDSFRISNLKKGNYQLTLFDAKGCSIPGCDFQIEDPVCDLVLSLNGTNNRCAGDLTGSIQSTLTGGIGPFTYDWSDDRFDGKNQAQGLASGSYQLIVTDVRLCKDTANVTITEPNALQTKCTVLAQPSTVGGTEGSARVVIQGGTGQRNIQLSGPSPGQIQQNSVDTFVFSKLAAGQYTVMLTDANGCTDTCGFTLNAIVCKLAGSVQTTHPDCNGNATGSILVNSTGNIGMLSYAWSNPALSGAKPGGLAAGTYSVTISDAAGCKDTLSATLNSPPVLKLSASQASQPSPARPTNGSIALLYSGGTPSYQINWTPNGSSQAISNNGNFTIANLSAGAYTITLTDSKGCTAQAQVSLVQPACNLRVTIAATRADCESSHLNTTVSGGTAPFLYSWSPNRFNGQANPRNASPGNYRVTVTDALGCLAIDSLILAVDPAALQVNFGVLDPYCPGDLGVFTIRSIAGGQGPFTLKLGNSPEQRFNNPPFSIRNLQAGNFDLHISNASGCSYDSSFAIKAPRNLSLELGPDTTLRRGASLTFNPQLNFGPVQIAWSPSEGLDNASILNARAEPANTTTYTLRLKDSLGCEISDKILVLVAGQLEAYFPTAFSPNGDDVNDYFSAFAGQDIETLEVLRVFDRWGNLVFEGLNIPLNDPSKGWDGTSRGQKSPIGLYVYSAVVRLRNGTTYRAAGEVNLVR